MVVRRSILRGVYKAEIKALDDKLSYLNDKLTEDLHNLVENKKQQVEQSEKLLSIANEEVSLAVEAYSDKAVLLNEKLHVESKLHKVLEDKLKGLSEKYEQVQLDIEDYEVLLTLLSDQNGKASVVSHYISYTECKLQ